MLIAQRPTLTEEKIVENRSRFIIEPLEPGFGYTLGHSLRRTLLSSVPGAAVIRFRIDGVLHEITSPPKALSLALTCRVKIMCNMDIGERRLPQDGRIELTVGGNPDLLDVRLGEWDSFF